MQIMRGLPEPRQGSSLPRLRLMQMGVRRDRAQHGIPPSRPRLPITPDILRRIHEAWTPRASEFDITMLWAAAVTCFFGFFRAGELTVPSASAFDPAVHLAWGDVAADENQPPSMVRVFLKRSKCDQFGRGVTVYVGKTDNSLCPVSAILAYVARRGDAPGAFFRFRSDAPLTKHVLSHTSERRYSEPVFVTRTTPDTVFGLVPRQRLLKLEYRTQRYRPLADGIARHFCDIFEPQGVNWLGCPVRLPKGGTDKHFGI